MDFSAQAATAALDGLVFLLVISKMVPLISISERTCLSGGISLCNRRHRNQVV